MALTAALAAWDVPSTSKDGAEHYRKLAVVTQQIHDFVYPKDIGPAIDIVKTREAPEVAEAFAYASKHGLLEQLFEDFLQMVEERFFLVKRDIQRFMRMIQESLAISVSPQTHVIMRGFFDRLVLWQKSWQYPLRKFVDAKLIASYIPFFHHLLHSSLPAVFVEYLHIFLASSLASIPPSSLDSDPATAPVNRPVPPPSSHLTRLGIFVRYSSIFMKVALEEISRIAQDEAGNGWDTRALSRARRRVSEGVVNWVAGMMEGQSPAGSDAYQATMRAMFTRFDYHLCKCFFEIRCDELFDIIVDYPDSMSALEDLKECLFKVDQRSMLVQKLQTANVKRLLHPGAETKDLLTQYISTIRCLRILDPPGVLLHKVAIPIRKELRSRPDTIKHIVATLVEGEDLQDENEPTAMLKDGAGDEEVEDWSDPKWEPEPFDAAPEFRSGKAGDIVSTLVSIYETRDVIVKELQILLAQRLLALKDYDSVKEIRIIELLKLRFGEAALQVCDVMLKDMADSKRVDDRIQGDIKTDVHPLVISHRFWPNIQTSSLHLPPKLESAQMEYESAFNKFKPDKHLRFVQHLGTITVKLELEDRIVEVEADAIQAAVAELFSEKESWKVSNLSEKLDLDVKTVQAALTFWENEGVVKDIDGVWEVIERLDE